MRLQELNAAATSVCKDFIYACGIFSGVTPCSFALLYEVLQMLWESGFSVIQACKSHSCHCRTFPVSPMQSRLTYFVYTLTILIDPQYV